MFRSPFIKISKSAINQNIEFIRSILKEGVKLSCVIKSNAYGHGVDEYVPLAESAGVDHFSVFSADEAFEVKRVCKPETDIMIMGFTDDQALPWCIEQGIEFYVFDFNRLIQVNELAAKMHKKAKLHIEIETGFNRTGFPISEFGDVLKYLKANESTLSFEGLCTHYAGAESIANYVRIQNQLKRFLSARRKAEKAGITPKRYHTASSAATIVYPNTQMDMVRIGIMQYGFWPTPETQVQYINRHGQPRQPLRRILSWKSAIMSIKKVKAGEFIGYGTSYLAITDKVIATVPVGYAHGFPRSLSNIGRVLVHGKRVGVIGTVNMNMMTIDVTALQQVKPGDEVVIIGHQGDFDISVASFSELSAQVNYETLTRLPANIRRLVVE
ncbi:alanine racemase [Lentimicrobium sp.]